MTEPAFEDGPLLAASERVNRATFILAALEGALDHTEKLSDPALTTAISKAGVLAAARVLKLRGELERVKAAAREGAK